MRRVFCKQNILVLVLAVLIICLSATTSYFVITKMDLIGGHGRGQRISFTDAVMACQDKTKREFGKQLYQQVVDRHSSRYEDDAYLYKIFIEAFTNKKKHEKERHYISCYIKPESGRIATFDANKDTKVNTSKALTKNSDKFIEWPN